MTLERGTQGLREWGMTLPVFGFVFSNWKADLEEKNDKHCVTVQIIRNQLM